MTAHAEIRHPVDHFLKSDAVPSVWCSGCGIGIGMHALFLAIEEGRLDHDAMCVVSGFGCTGRVSEYVRLRSYNVVDGTVFGFGAKLSDENPGLKVVVFSNNTDFLMTGGQDFMEIRKRRPNLLVVHVNNFFYIVTEKGLIPTTPFNRSSTADFADVPYNIPLTAKAFGASFIARWTPFHAGWLKYSMMDALLRQGFSMIEIVSPCMLYYANESRIGSPVERMKFYNDNTVMRNNISMEYLDIRAYRKIIVGKFLDRG